MRDDGLLRRFSELRWTPATRTPDLEVCISADDQHAVDLGEVAVNVGTVLERITEALGLPMSGLGVRIEASLGKGTFEIRAQSRVRLRGELGVPAGEWLQRHRAAGPLGRTGVVAVPPDLDAPMRPEDLLVRAAEAVAWADPSELDRLEAQRVRELIPEGLDVTSEDLPRWRGAIRGLLRARISLKNVPQLSPRSDGVPWLEPSAPRLAEDLERPPNELRVGADAFAKLWPAQGPVLLQRLISQAVDGIWSTIGVACTPAPVLAKADDLPPWGFEVVIHGLVRAAGEVPEAAQEWIHPTTGVRTNAPPRYDSDAISRSLAAQVGACLEEAAPEFVDLASVEEYLAQQAERLAELVGVVRHRVPDDMLAEVLYRLVEERRSLRGASVLERLLEAGEQPVVELVADDAEQEAALRWAEYWREVTALAELARTAAPLTRPPAWRMTLDASSIAELRAAADETDAAAPVLQQVDAAASSHPDEDGVLVVPLDLRPAVARLVRAQLPALRVLTTHESVEVQVDDDRPA